MQTITIASQKGGSGKTTLALHLGTLAQRDGATLLVDGDPQGSLAYWYSRRAAERPLVVGPVSSSRFGEVLETALEEGIDFAFIDTAPHDSAAMAAAIRPADLVLIPARPSALDLHAVEATIRMADTLKHKAMVVLSQCPPKRLFGEPSAIREARDIITGMGGSVAASTISTRTIAATAVIAGMAVSEIEPSGHAAGEFEALWAEIKGAMGHGTQAVTGRSRRA